MKIKNAKILKASLYIQDHGILTFDVVLDLGDSQCALGGYSLDKITSYEPVCTRIATPAGLSCMRQIMEVVGVDSWEDLANKYVRYEDNGLGTRITTIGHILDDRWINVESFFENFDYDNYIIELSKNMRGVSNE